MRNVSIPARSLRSPANRTPGMRCIECIRARISQRLAFTCRCIFSSVWHSQRAYSGLPCGAYV